MRAAVFLWNVVGKAKYLLGEAVIPLNGSFYSNAVFFTFCIKDLLIKNMLGLIDVFNKALHATLEVKLFNTSLKTLIGKANVDPIVKKTEFP